MKLIVNNRHIKTIPMEYSVINDIEDHLEDFEHKRLSRNERVTLNKRLKVIRFDAELTLFLNDLKRNNPIVHEMINNQEVHEIRRINTKHSHYNSIVFDNRIELKCPEALFDLVDREHKAIVHRLY